jgi:hypothetical protein
VSEDERRATFERVWEIGGLALWVGSFNDLLVNEQSNRAAYDFWRDKTRARIEDPAVAEMLAPTEPLHPYGTKRPSLEQNFFDIFNQSNVSLVDLRKTPIEGVTRSGIGPTCAELQGDWITQMLDHVRQRDWARFEATTTAEEAWRAQVMEIANGTLFPRADSWYLGANIPGKRREMLSFAGGLSTYMAKCNKSAERGYEGFAIG